MSRIKLSFAVTVCNELEEIKKLLPNLIENKHKDDEIVILYDYEKGNIEMSTYLQEIEKRPNNIFLFYHKLNNDFASFKNNFLTLCKGEYIIQLDADEIPSDGFWEYLPAIFETEPLADSFLISRKNIVNGITPEHIEQWGWQVSEDEGNTLINWPDNQHRIFANNGKIHWINKVHELLEGMESISLFPPELFLWHIKDISKQEKQNLYYNTIQ